MATERKEVIEKYRKKISHVSLIADIDNEIQTGSKSHREKSNLLYEYT